MLNYTVTNSLDGSKIPIVLLHGFLESSTMWGHVQFPENYPLVKIDLPGHGKSVHEDLIVDSVSEMAIAVIDVLDKLELEEYHLIGHSMGGYVALEIKYLDLKAQKVMLLNSNFWSDSQQKVKDRLRVAEIVKTNKAHFIYEVIPNLFLNPQPYDNVVKSLISEALKMSSEAIAKASVAMSSRKDYTNFIQLNSSCFTCVQGSEDPIVPVAKMRGLLYGSEVKYIEIENVGHMAHIESPDKLNEIVVSFLSESDSRGPVA